MRTLWWKGGGGVVVAFAHRRVKGCVIRDKEMSGDRHSRKLSKIKTPLGMWAPITILQNIFWEVWATYPRSFTPFDFTKEGP